MKRIILALLFAASLASAQNATLTPAQLATLKAQAAASAAAADTLKATIDAIAVTPPDPQPNAAPTVSAGPAQTVTLPALASLTGSASDDGVPAGSSLTVAWSKVSGPGTVIFGSPSLRNTTVSFSVAGPYALRLSASDGLLASTADVAVTVNPAVIPPPPPPPPPTGTTRYIRDGGTSTTCADWTDACDVLPATLTRGTTYYVADGSYAGYTFNDAVSGTTYQFVRKATAADHGVDTGWQSTYGDGVATFANLSFEGTGYVDVTGLTATEGVGIEARDGQQPSDTHHITVRDVTARSLFIVAQDVIIKGGSYGGFNGCTSSNPEDIVMVWQSESGGTYRASSRITFDGVTIHDITDNGNQCAGQSTSGRHVDCLQILAGHFITIKNSRFYNCATSSIMARPFRDSLNDITIENNFFQEVMNPGASVNLMGTGDSLSGTNVFRYNTMGSGNLLINPSYSGSNWQVYGNIMEVQGCSSKATYSYNVFVDGSVCGTNAVAGTPAMVGPKPSPSFNNGIAPNYHLSGASNLAIGKGHPTLFPATDIDGQARVTPSTAGADQP